MGVLGSLWYGLGYGAWLALGHLASCMACRTVDTQCIFNHDLRHVFRGAEIVNVTCAQASRPDVSGKIVVVGGALLVNAAAPGSSLLCPAVIPIEMTVLLSLSVAALSRLEPGCRGSSWGAGLQLARGNGTSFAGRYQSLSVFASLPCRPAGNRTLSPVGKSSSCL